MSERVVDAVTEKTLTQINLGRTADVVYSQLRPLISDQERVLLSSLKGAFRAGNLTLSDVQCKLAQLVVLDDLEERLKTQIRAGDRAATKVHGKGDTP